MALERILITVKTYPTLSAKYGELVCTAGLRENGSWIRIYPVPFRSLEEYQKFEKYRIIEAQVTNAANKLVCKVKIGILWYLQHHASLRDWLLPMLKNRQVRGGMSPRNAA